MSDFGRFEYRRARKAHECVWCAELVLAGEEHLYTHGRYDGEWYENRWHIECELVWQRAHAGSCDWEEAMIDWSQVRGHSLEERDSFHRTDDELFATIHAA